MNSQWQHSIAVLRTLTHHIPELPLTWCDECNKTHSPPVCSGTGPRHDSSGISCIMPDCNGFMPITDSGIQWIECDECHARVEYQPETIRYG